MGFADFVSAVAPLVPVVGPAIGAVAGLIGSRSTNSAQDARQVNVQDFNSQEAQVNRDWSANQAAITRDYQERLSNSAYQRAVSDMRAAGINPMLAYSQGGASVPVGATGASSAASAPSPAPVQNVAEGASRGAAAMMASAQQFAGIQNTAAQTKATLEQANKTRIEADILDDQRRDESIMVGLGDEDPQPVPRRHKYTSNELIRINAILARETAGLKHEERNLVVQEVQNAIAENRRILANTDNMAADTVLKTLRAEGEEGVASRFWKENPWFYPVREGTKLGSEVINSAANAIGKGLQYSPYGRAGQGLKLLRR